LKVAQEAQEAVQEALKVAQEAQEAVQEVLMRVLCADCPASGWPLSTAKQILEAMQSNRCLSSNPRLSQQQRS
jgi:hypothetical protein